MYRCSILNVSSCVREPIHYTYSLGKISFRIGNRFAFWLALIFNPRVDVPQGYYGSCFVQGRRKGFTTGKGSSYVELWQLSVRANFKPCPKIINLRPKSHRSAIISNSIGLSPIAGLWLALIPDRSTNLVNQYQLFCVRFAYQSCARAYVHMP